MGVYEDKQSGKYGIRIECHYQNSVLVSKDGYVFTTKSG